MNTPLTPSIADTASQSEGSSRAYQDVIAEKLRPGGGYRFLGGQVPRSQPRHGAQHDQHLIHE